MTEPILSQVFAGKTGVMDPADFDTAFGEILAKFNAGISNANIAANAAIDWRKLAQPYHTYRIQRCLLPDTAGPAADWISTPSSFDLDGSTRLVLKDFIRLDPSEVLWLCEVDVWAIDVTTLSSPYPRVEIYKNGTLLPGGTCDISTDDTSNPSAPFRLYRTNPIANPLEAFGDGDVLEYRLGRSAAGTPQARGIYVSELWKGVGVR
jgi:hypothetical protein